MVNSRQLLDDTLTRFDRSLIFNQCNLAFEEKIKSENEEVDELEQISRRAQSLTDQIRSVRSYDGLRVSMRQNILNMEQSISSELDEQSALLAQYLPLLSLPKNPAQAVKYLKNFALKDIFPKVKAAVRYTGRLIALAAALSELAVEVERGIEYLENYVRTSDEEARLEQLSAIQRLSFALQAKIQNTISEQICLELKANGIDANKLQSVYDAIDELIQIRDDLGLATENIRGLIGSNLSTIDSLQTAMSDISGVSPGINTNDVDSYIESIINGDDKAYLDANEQIASIKPPANITPPQIIYVANSTVVSGNVNVASELSILEGTWENPVDNTFFEWYVDDELVANTQTFTPTANAINKSISAKVLKENFVAIIEANTQVITNVNNPFVFVSNIDTPDIIGTIAVGETITCSQGLWDGTSPLTYSYQWEYAKTGEPILGETSPTYTIDAEDKNRTLRCKVTGTNILGSNSIYSSTTIRVP